MARLQALGAILGAILLIGSPLALSRGGHGSSQSYSSSSHRSTYATGVPRDSNGRIARSPSARAQFQHQNACPATGKTSGACPGYVVDHVTPLKRGGSPGHPDRRHSRA